MSISPTYRDSDYVCLFLDTMCIFLTSLSEAACTCPGESHPGPMRKDGSYVGRAAPEIDVFEALVDADGGKVFVMLLAFL